MTQDLVFPQGNEEALVAMARKLGFQELLLCYQLKDPLLKERKKEIEKLATKDLKVSLAIIVTNQQDVMRAKQLCENVVALPFPGAFEDKRVTHVFGIESGRREDFLHHRNSGLTQVSLRDALRTGKTLLVDAGALFDGEKHPSVILGRILQNNQFLRKEPDVPVRVVSGAREPLRMRAPRDLQDLLRL